MSVLRPVQSSLVDGYEFPTGQIPWSVMHGDNAGLIAAVAPLYLTGSVLDVTYGLGAWWRKFQPEPFAGHDLATDGVDFRALPYPDSSWDTVCFDPPYQPTRAPQTATRRAVAFREAYGLTFRLTRADLDALIADGLAECARVSRRFVLTKCCDYAQNPQVFTLGHVAAIVAGEEAGLRVHDLIVHATRPGPSNGSMTRIHRTRRSHSYLIVFKAKP